jgi:hypothetical protein
MLERWMNAKTEEGKVLGFLQNFFLLIAAFGFFFYGVEHWVIDHYMESFWARWPFYVSMIGFPLAIAMFFTTHKAVRLPFTIWMVVSVLTGFAGALLHLIWNANDLGVSLFTISGILESFQVPYRPVLAGLAHTHVGAVGLVVGLTAVVTDSPSTTERNVP